MLATIKVKYVILAFASFLCIIFANVALLFKPLYTKVYYGQADPIFYYGISSVVLIILYIIFKTVVVKKTNVSYDKNNDMLPIRNVMTIYLSSIVIILIISAIIGWNVKPFYDLGENFTGFQLIIHAVKLIYFSILLLFVVLMIENFQYGLEGIFKFKNPILNSYFPVGGIATMLTYGIYQIVMDLSTLTVIYFILISIYGIVYLLAERSFSKTYLTSLLIFLF